MRILKIVALFLVIFSGIDALAQTGTIRGKVVDDATGEEMIGVTVVIQGTSNGAATDFEGTFSIQAAEGTHNLQVSFISYNTLTVRDIQVKAGEVTALGTLRMGEAVEELAEVVITAEAIKSSETALLTIKRKSPNLIDGISAETFSRIGDSDAAAAIKRVPGVSIQGGQYVFVRGLGDRYTKTVLSGMEVPGLDPDRNAVQIDIFPTNLIDNIIVYKNFTPELSADFVGGTVDIVTKDFPEEKTIVASASFEYNPSMHFNSDYLNYEGGGTDFLGIDDGTRDLPFDGRASDIPDPRRSNPSATITDITRSFDPVLAAQRENSFANYSLGLSAGNQFDKDSYKLGYNAAINYSNNTTFYEDAVDAAYIKPASSEQTQLQPNVVFRGPLAINDTQLSGLLGGAIKTDASKYNLTLMHIQNGTSRAAKRGRAVSGFGNSNTSIVDNLEYTERFLTNVMASGEHYLKGSDLNIDWKLASTFSTINDRDVRITPFTIGEDGSLTINPQEGGEPQRIWRLLDEQNYVAKLDFTKNFQWRGLDSKLKFGVSNILKFRDYEIQSFITSILGSQAALNLNGDSDRLYAPENIWTPETGVGVYVDDIFSPSNSYEGRINILGAYVSGEVGLTEKLKAIVGVRVEQYDQFYTGVDQAGGTGGNPVGQVFDDENVLSSLEFFPSLNLIYSVVDNSNLRLSYSRTIARPSFKEKSTAEIQDVLTGRTFIGNIDLVETNINNYDIRWEYFFKGGQTISVGAFYKTFENPIELVRQPQASNDFKPTNVGDADIIGAELEIRKDLSFISPRFQNFSITTNVTVTDAAVKIDETESEGRRNGLRAGEEFESERDFIGQPPYIINAGLVYNSFETGFESTLSYNVQGRTLAVVGINRTPDTYSVPFNSLNFNISKRFGVDKKNKIGLRVTNILDDVREREFESFGSDEFIETSREPGTAFRIKFTREF